VVFFPISVFRLDIVSETEQRVWTPGIDLQAVLVPVSNHVLTAGLTFYRDRSSDRRTTTTTTSMVGQVALGPRGPAPVVFPTPIALGLPSVAPEFPVTMTLPHKRRTIGLPSAVLKCMGMTTINLRCETNDPTLARR